ncbi:hypothetical protein BDN71DRAFT_1438318 [Pleurotus eryngii]|uniref:Uncharacterized protein n=1 Tax=Pleurotus eryngii TaxID=5323 RepID=A0A9P6A509_PLEER|nr:hypothetical protein BDN71DRAFT_1442192 [Pleurotus eryngii]KAF9501699.1 hypothetical protein BDN71DRAFT_1438318 [Pleurotus eryngii]
MARVTSTPHVFVRLIWESIIPISFAFGVAVSRAIDAFPGSLSTRCNVTGQGPKQGSS